MLLCNCKKQTNKKTEQTNIFWNPYGRCCQVSSEGSAAKDHWFMDWQCVHSDDSDSPPHVHELLTVPALYKSKALWLVWQPASSWTQSKNFSFHGAWVQQHVVCWSHRSDITLRWSAWAGLCTLALRHRQPFSRTAGGDCGPVWRGIAHPHCATLGRTLTDEWPDVINSLSRWFWDKCGSIGAWRTTGFDTVHLQKPTRKTSTSTIIGNLCNCKFWPLHFVFSPPSPVLWIHIFLWIFIPFT